MLEIGIDYRSNSVVKVGEADKTVGPEDNWLRKNKAMNQYDSLKVSHAQTSCSRVVVQLRP